MAMAARKQPSTKCTVHGGVEVGVLEQAGAEEGAQQPGGRGLEARPGRRLAVALGDEAVGLDDGGGLAVAAELVDAVVDGQAVALGDAEVLHPVAALPEIAHLRIRIGGDAPMDNDCPPHMPIFS